jgi:choline dehydrogenase
LQDHPTVPIYLVPKEGQCIPARDSRLQVLARFTAEGSREVDDLQLIMTTHTDISASPELREAAGGPVVAILKAGLMAPRGHGRVTLASTDPDVQPKIELNYGADPEDMRRLLHGTRLAWKIARSEPLGRETRGVVGLDEATVCSDERLREYILEHVGTYCHASGTARMGPDGDPGAVTDPHCRVRGVEGLWLADASVMPRIPCCGPNFTVMMLGERIADWLSGRETARQ